MSAVGDPAFTGVDAQTSAVLQYESGAHAVLTCTLESATPRQAFVAGTEGVVTIDPVWYAPTRLRLTRRSIRTSRVIVIARTPRPTSIRRHLYAPPFAGR